MVSPSSSHIVIADPSLRIQDVFLLDRVLHSIPHLLRPYRQIWHLAFGESTWYHFTGNVRLIIFRCWDRRWRHFHLLLANNEVLYWRLGRLCTWLVDPMFPRRRAHPSLGRQMAYVHRYAAPVLVVDPFILCQHQRVLSSVSSFVPFRRCITRSYLLQLPLLAPVSSCWVRTVFQRQGLKRYFHTPPFLACTF
jgi:hypothetical protein